MATVSSPLLPASNPHPLYAYFAPQWVKLAHVYEGTGGFLDGTYLVAHPREWTDYLAANPQTPTKKLKARRALARYENIAFTVIEQKRSAMFRESVTRTVGDSTSKTTHPIEDWWENVDGNYCGIDDWMSSAWIIAAVFGYAIHVMDRPNTEPAATRADEKAPFLRLYSPLDMIDWATDDRNTLLAVRLLEGEGRPDLTQPQPSQLNVRERVIDQEMWKVSDAGSSTSGAHGFGALPVVLQYAGRRALAGIVGRSVLGDPQLYIDHYNLTSELRELLRNQTFGLLNAPLMSDQGVLVDIEAAKNMLGTEAGAENIVFSPEPLNYIQPDTNNVVVYQAEREQLSRMIYRTLSLPWESDSKDAEAAGSLSLKREDLNQRLAMYADECEKSEYQIAKMWFRGYYGPEKWEAEWDKAKVVIRYPDNFNITPFADVLQEAQAAMGLEMGPLFMAELKKRLVAKFLPDQPVDKLEMIEEEIDKLVQEDAQRKVDMEKAKLAAMQVAPTLTPRPPRVNMSGDNKPQP